jgi:hypothetical protein
MNENVSRAVMNAYRTLVRAVNKTFYRDREVISKAIVSIKSQFRNPNGPPLYLDTEKMSVQDQIRVAYHMAEFMKNHVVQGKLETTKEEPTIPTYSFILQDKHRLDAQMKAESEMPRGPCRTRCPDCTCQDSRPSNFTVHSIQKDRV